MFSVRTRSSRIVRAVGTLAVVGGMAATLAPPAGAAPPAPPGGCSVVVNTPAAVTGSTQGQANKTATFDRLCVVS
jgi:hypothetical protein